MASIFSIFGEIFIDNQKANKEIDTTTEKAEKSGSKIGKAFSAIGNTMLKVGTAVGTGAAAIGTAAYGLASKTASHADEIDKVSQKLGLSRESYQEWDYVLSQAGVEVTNMTTGFKTFTNKMDDAKNGSASALKMFEKLGISLDDLNSMSREDAFNAVITAMQGMEDSTERAALANDLFGKSGQELTALFNQTAEQTEELKNKAHELGMVMSDEAVDAGVGLVDTMDTLKKAGEGLFNSLGTIAMPIIQKVADALIKAVPAAQKFMEKFLPTVQSAFEAVVPPLMQLGEALLPAIMNAVEQLLPVFQNLATTVLPIIVGLIESFAPLLTEIISAVLPMLSDLLALILPLIGDLAEAILPALTTLIEALMPLLKPLMEALKSIIEAILPPLTEAIKFLTEKVLPPLQEAFKVLAEIVTSRLKGALESIKNIFDNVKGVLSGIIDFVKNVFTGNWRGAWDAVAKIFSNIWSGIKEAFKIPINWIIDGINGFIRGINKIQIPDWVPLVGGKGFKLGEIPRLRIGMEYVPYDDMPALLHRGERVLTASENKKYNETERLQASETSKQAAVIKIEFGEKSIYINRLDGKDESSINGFVDMIIELIYEKIRRKEATFA